MGASLQKILNFIGGQMCEPMDGSFIETMEPATGKTYALVPDSGEEDLQRAVDAAQKAFPIWRDMGPDGRGAIMNKMADLLDQNRDAFIQAEITDNGMTRNFAANVEIPRGAANFRAFAKAALDFCAPRSFKNNRAQGSVRHEPVGVVATISPWNMPFLLFTWKIAPALASGNCVIAKPSEVTPMTAYLLSALANEAGFPAGVLNVLHGTGQKIGKAITEHPDILRLSFTGSTATGHAINMACAQAFKKPPTLEMGGKNPGIVFADADFDAAVDGIMKAAFTNQGQICLCASRLYIQEDIYERFRDALVEKVKTLVTGDPMDEKTQHGASVSQAHMEKVLSYIALAKSEGGNILCGGRRAKLEGRCAGGYFIEPTLIEGLGNTCRTNQEEIFGPVATLMKFKTEEEAVALANQSSYGLAATIWTQDMEKARRVADALETGMPWVNCWNLRVLETPFGGYKNSGNGHREGIPDAMEFFTEKKTVTMPVLEEKTRNHG